MSSNLLDQYISKIQAYHLEREACVYVRQSSLYQVIHNTGSGERQRALVQRARDLGWSDDKIFVLDGDQAQSGSSTYGRDDFKWIVSEIISGKVGAVFITEISRVGRNSGDLHHLINICDLFGVLVIDEKEILEPRNTNDHLLLSVKAVFSHLELKWIIDRMMGAKKKKVEEGSLRLPLPTGYVRDLSGKTVFDPSERVQQAVRHFFETFDRLGTAGGVVRYFHDNDLKFPTVNHSIAVVNEQERVKWVRLSLSRAVGMLNNPAYAGVYSYNRTKLEARAMPGNLLEIKKYVVRQAFENWILRRDTHEGYISWEKYLQNREKLLDNCNAGHANRRKSRGATRSGGALLHGIVYCGICGKRMRPSYPSKGRFHYYCRDSAIHKEIQSIRGVPVDEAISYQLLQTIEPAQLMISVNTLIQVEAQVRQTERQFDLRLEEAQYQANLARRRYENVDPENRLVASNLERHWNECLEEVRHLQEKTASALPPPLARLNKTELEAIIALASDLPKIWRAESTTQIERKQLLRCLIKDITLTRKGMEIHVGIRWETGACTELRFSLVKGERSAHHAATLSGIYQRVSLIRELAATHTDEQIAERLNAEGLKPLRSKSFTSVHITNIRNQNNIPSGCPEIDRSSRLNYEPRGDGRYNVITVAKILNRHYTTVEQWCREGLLDAIRSKSNSGWWINLNPAHIKHLKRTERQRFANKTALKQSGI